MVLATQAFFVALFCQRGHADDDFRVFINSPSDLWGPLGPTFFAFCLWESENVSDLSFQVRVGTQDAVVRSLTAPILAPVQLQVELRVQLGPYTELIPSTPIICNHQQVGDFGAWEIFLDRNRIEVSDFPVLEQLNASVFGKQEAVQRVP